MDFSKLADAVFEGYAQKFLRFGSKFERKFLQNSFGIAVHDEADGFFHTNTALLAVEELVFRDFAGRGLVFKDGAVVVAVGVGPRVRSTFIAHQQGVAL